MKKGLSIKNSIVIPEQELIITTSGSGGPGGQHVNKTQSRITIRWNVLQTTALTDEQKQRVYAKLSNRLTTEGDLLINNSSSRSQQHNKEQALNQLADEIRKALIVPKKRMKTKVPVAVKESQLQAKKQRSQVKKMRSKKFGFE